MSQNKLPRSRNAVAALVLAVGVALGLLYAPSAQAHAKLVESTPAADSVIASPQAIMLTFSQGVEALEAKLTNLQTGSVSELAPPMNHGATLHYTVGAPLAAGKYELSFRVTTPDTHVTAGTVSFQVK